MSHAGADRRAARRAGVGRLLGKRHGSSQRKKLAALQGERRMTAASRLQDHSAASITLALGWGVPPSGFRGLNFVGLHNNLQKKKQSPAFLFSFSLFPQITYVLADASSPTLTITTGDVHRRRLNEHLGVALPAKVDLLILLYSAVNEATAGSQCLIFFSSIPIQISRSRRQTRHRHTHDIEATLQTCTYTHS